MHVNFQIEAGSQDVVANEAPLPSLFDRPFNDQCRMGELLAEIDIRFFRADREAGDHHSFDQLVRILVDDVTVLERSRLGFVTVTNQIDRLGVVRRDERPLHPRRETRSPTAAKP